MTFSVQYPDDEFAEASSLTRDDTASGVSRFSFSLLAIFPGVIYCSGYVGSVILPPRVKAVVLLLLILYLGLRFLRMQKVLIPLSRYFPSLLIYVSICIFFIISLLFHGVANGSLLPFLCLSAALLLVLNYPFETFISTYNFVLKVITVIGIICLALNQFDIPSQLPVVFNPGNELYSYYNGLLYFQFTMHPSTLITIFWESGLYCSFLLWGIIFELYFVNRKPDWITGGLFLSGIILSKSTAGILLAGFVLGTYQRNNTLSLFYVLRVIFLGAAAIVLAFHFPTVINWLNELAPSLFWKLADPTAVTTTTRLYSPLLNWHLFMEAPWIGWGFNDAGLEYLNLLGDDSRGRIDAQTSTSGAYLAALGIGGLFYTLAWVWGIMRQHFGLATKLILTAAVLLIINKEPHVYLLTSYIIMLYLLGPFNMEMHDSCGQ